MALSLPLDSFDVDAYALYGRFLIQKINQKLKPRVSGPGPVILPTHSGFHPPPPPRHRRPVGILGAGAGGLYAALILEDLGIPYHIIEARDRVGGRLFTHKFPDDTGEPYNYYDVGAMRFPKIASMQRVFALFDYPPLNRDGIALKRKLQHYIFASGKAFYDYNDVTVRQSEVPPGDPFKASQVIKDVNPDPYIAAGTSAIVDDVIRPFATGILKDLKKHLDFDKFHGPGWVYMQGYDLYSTRAYMSTKYLPSPRLPNLPATPLPTDVVNWCETFDKSTGWYDRALTETVLEAIAFGWQPEPNPPPTEWFCIDGGAQQIAECMKKYIVRCKPNAITFNSKVTCIALNEHKSGIDVTTDYTDHHQFSHVISTIPLTVLRTIDLKKAELDPMQANALRELDYGPSIKVGLQFKTAWWTTATNLAGERLNIVGGQSYTDRPVRTIVYPSFGDVQDAKTTTLIASYCWTEDAARTGALIDKDDKTLLKLVLRDLADIHNLSVDFLRGQLIGYHGYDWAHDPYTMGSFAFFGPGKFENLYTSLNHPAAKGYLHFAGEAISVRHAWVEGALDSVSNAIQQMLYSHDFTKEQRKKFVEHWGVKNEWVVRDPEREGGPVTVDLLYEHLVLTNPELFGDKGSS
jgi:monoamine oxidase